MDENNDEIIVGVNIPKNKKEKKVKSKLKKTKSKNKEVAKKATSKEKKNKARILGKSKIFRNRFIRKCILLFLIVIAIFFILSSSFFDIKEIVVEGNNVVSKDEIKTLLQLENKKNIFSISEKDIKNCLSQNAYIENVSIERKLPNILDVQVVERKIKYMIQIGDGWAYISNQGYILDISNESKIVPIIIGLSTDLSEIKVGSRLNDDDLKKFEILNRISEIANSNGILELISKIDISDSQNYTLYLDTENKIAYLGDCSDLNTRILFVKAITEQEKGKEGEIFVNVDLNEENVYFREKSF